MIASAVSDEPPGSATLWTLPFSKYQSLRCHDSELPAITTSVFGNLKY